MSNNDHDVQERLEQIRSSVRLASNVLQDDPKYKQLAATLRQDLAMSMQTKKHPQIPDDSETCKAMEPVVRRGSELAQSAGKNDCFAIDKDALATARANGAVKDAEARLVALSELKKQTDVAVQVLLETTAGIGLLLSKFGDDSRTYLNEMRSVRMTAVGELQTIQKQVADLRRYFGDKEHVEQVARMRDFAELCERFQKLHSSGFLDDVVSVMLKMEK